MRALRHTFSLSIAIASIVYSSWLARPGAIPVEELGYAVWVIPYFMGVATIILATVYKWEVRSAYFETQSFERSGHIYQWCGVRYFGSALRIIGWEKFRRKHAPIRTDSEALKKYSSWTRGAEAVHVLAGVMTAVFTIWFGSRHSIVGTKWLWLTNALVNLYPVLLQRYNRPRAERLIQMVEARNRIPGSINTEPSDT